MALGLLGIIYIIIIAGVAIAQFSLYKMKSNQKYFMINMALGILIALLAFTSVPSNYTAQRILTLALGLLGILGYYMYSKGKNELLAKILLSISVIGSAIQLFI